MKSTRLLDPQQEIEAENRFYTAVLQLRSVAECRDFFLDLCTPAELQALKDRWLVAELLCENLTYRDIHERTGVSVTTVGRVARCLKQPPAGYTTVLQRLGKLK